MSTTIDIVCDRCGRTVHGVILEATEVLPRITARFYEVGEGSAWREFAMTEDEQNVCDPCMWADPDFIVRYPGDRKIPRTGAPTQPRIKNPKEVAEIKEKRIEAMGAKGASSESKEKEDKDKDKDKNKNK